MATLTNPLDPCRIDIEDSAKRQAFYEALIGHGAPLARQERMQAFRARLIDEEGHVVDRSRLTDVGAKLSVEQ